MSRFLDMYFFLSHCQYEYIKYSYNFIISSSNVHNTALSINVTFPLSKFISMFIRVSHISLDAIVR